MALGRVVRSIMCLSKSAPRTAATLLPFSACSSDRIYISSLSGRPSTGPNATHKPENAPNPQPPTPTSRITRPPTHIAATHMIRTSAPAQATRPATVIPTQRSDCSVRTPRPAARRRTRHARADHQRLSTTPCMTHARRPTRRPLFSVLSASVARAQRDVENEDSEARRLGPTVAEASCVCICISNPRASRSGSGARVDVCMHGRCGRGRSRHRPRQRVGLPPATTKELVAACRSCWLAGGRTCSLRPRACLFMRNCRVPEPALTQWSQAAVLALGINHEVLAV